MIVVAFTNTVKKVCWFFISCRLTFLFPCYNVRMDHMIKDVRFVRRDEMAGMTIYPEELKTTLWEDLKSGLSETKYLGVERSEISTYLGSPEGPT